MRFTSFLPGIIWFIISAVLLALPGNDLPHNKLFNIPFFDKYVHFAMFFMLTTLFCYPLIYRGTNVSTRIWINKVAVYVILYGIVMEFVQKYFVSQRSFDLIDIVFDSLGSMVGLIAAKIYLVKKNRPQ